MMAEDSAQNPKNSYDAVSKEYTQRIAHELDHKPFDRALLNRFAERTRGLGVVAEVGCGPGHVARYLHERGVRVVGFDLSYRMVEQAKQLSPQIDFRQGDMRSMDVPPHSWAAIAAFYSIIHIPRDQVVSVLREFRRVLQPGGLLLLAFHIGDQVVHLDEWWGHPVCVDFVFFTSDEMSGYLRTAGFKLEQALERDPYAPEVEHQSRRGYILARVSRDDDEETA